MLYIQFNQGKTWYPGNAWKIVSLSRNRENNIYPMAKKAPLPGKP